MRTTQTVSHGIVFYLEFAILPAQAWDIIVTWTGGGRSIFDERVGLIDGVVIDGAILRSKPTLEPWL